ncbi:2-keto-4-pentenoate hydratase [Elioraea thermophila]|uniref:2-keto-4-pentenoate hydratase n=1 Tax=Elioraea thermophila TaxID=2185104 RepID=UPI000DF1E440|nr:fumarylacetoacetate hydrolase family protein [Elioraea thermophila]
MMAGSDGRAAAAAEAIAAQRAADGWVRPLEPALAPGDAAEGYAIQAAQAHRAGCWPPAGFKVGATAATMQLHLGIRTPAAGYLDPASLRSSGYASALGQWRNPGVEAEIALRLGADLPPGEHSPERLAEAVAEVLPAIEIVENRYEGGVAIGTPMLIADRFFHAAAVLGPPAPGWPPSRLAGRDLAQVRGRLLLDGAVFAEGTGADLLGHPLAVLRWLAASPAAAVFDGLRAGQIVLCGSVTVPAWLSGPAEVEVAFDGLGSVSARFLP